MDSNRITYNDTVLTKSERYFHLQNYNEMFTKLYVFFRDFSTKGDNNILLICKFTKSKINVTIVHNRGEDFLQSK